MRRRAVRYNHPVRVYLSIQNSRRLVFAAIPHAVLSKTTSGAKEIRLNVVPCRHRIHPCSSSRILIFIQSPFITIFSVLQILYFFWSSFYSLIFQGLRDLLKMEIVGATMPKYFHLFIKQDLEIFRINILLPAGHFHLSTIMNTFV